MRQYIISLLTLLSLPATATDIPQDSILRPTSIQQDSIHAAGDSISTDHTGIPVAADYSGKCASTDINVSDTTYFSSYDRRVYRYRKLWDFLIPTQLIVQYAGNMGAVSVGLGWDYGCHRQYETNLLFGYLPKCRSQEAKMTMTLKQNFVPWKLKMTANSYAEPLSFGIYFNTVFGQEFWGKQPKRYPDKYYPMLSTKVRINVFAGQRLSYTVPHNRRKFVKSLTAFYEISTCDIYVRTMVQDGSVKLWDILGLSLGMKVQIL